MANLKSINTQFKLAANEGAWMEVIHPTTGEVVGLDTGRPMRFKVLHKEADIVKRVQEAGINDMAIRYQRSGKIIKTDELRRREVDMLVAATVDWENVDDDENQNIPCSQAICRRYYMDADWLRNQVDSFSSNGRNYGGDEENNLPLASDVDAFFEAQEKN